MWRKWWEIQSFFRLRRKIALWRSIFSSSSCKWRKTAFADWQCALIWPKKKVSLPVRISQSALHFWIAEFLCEIMEVLLYILLPDEDFQCKPLRFLLRDIFANGVILPLFDLVADPDYINQAMLWIVRVCLLLYLIPYLLGFSVCETCPYPAKCF